MLKNLFFETSNQKPILLFLLFIFLASTSLQTQNLLNNPESVVFDPSQNRYLVSNWADGDGNIVQIDGNGVQSYFSTVLAGQFKIAGLYMFHDTLLAASGVASDAGLTGFDLSTGDTLFHIVLPDIGLPNDITSDSNGIIYVTDYWGSKLYKIENRVPSVFISQGLLNPNGIYYDAQNHQLLILSVTGSNSPILAVDPESATISTVVYTGFPGLDGITMDDDRNFYISTWGTDAVYRYGSEFNNPPELFSSGHNDPADIYYDKINRVLCVPNFSSNTVDFVQVVTSINEYDEMGLNQKFTLHQNHPNPFHKSTTINYVIPHKTNSTIAIYDFIGREIKILFNGFHKQGSYAIDWDGTDESGKNVTAGVYFCSIRSGCEILSIEILKN